MSFGDSDLTTPEAKEKLIIADADKKAMKFLKAYQRGLITGQAERHRNVRDVWNHATEAVGKALMAKLKDDRS